MTGLLLHLLSGRFLFPRSGWQASSSSSDWYAFCCTFQPAVIFPLSGWRAIVPPFDWQVFLHLLGRLLLHLLAGRSFCLFCFLQLLAGMCCLHCLPAKLFLHLLYGRLLCILDNPWMCEHGVGRGNLFFPIQVLFQVIRTLQTRSMSMLSACL